MYGIVCHAVSARFAFVYFMNRMPMRNWKVFCWNVHGLNSETRQRSVREKITESQCAVACLQETKLFDCPRSLIKSICPGGFDQFIESPSRGASGGILTVWRSNDFKGVLIEVKPFGIVISFTSVHNSDQWFLVNVYGPCQGIMRDEFVN